MANALNLILVRIVPTTQRSAAQFNSDLQGLTITAYDLTIDNNDPTSGGVSLGKASGIVPASAANLAADNFQGLPGELVIHDPKSANPTLKDAIMQHFLTIAQPVPPTPLTPFVPGVYTYAAVATAVIIAVPPAGHLEYPTPTSYDLRLQVERNGLKIDDATIDFNTTILQVDKLSRFQQDYMGLAPSDAPPPWANSIIPSAYLSIPPAPPKGTLDLITADIVKGQPPPFYDLLSAIDTVLKSEHPAADKPGKYTLELSDPLTPPQCQQVASELVWNRIRYPAPIPSSPTLEAIYTAGKDKSASQDQQQWEGSLSSYHSTHEAEALMLSKFVYAASCAVWAEKQTILASTAALAFPVLDSLQNSSTTVNSLSILLEGVAGQFVVPAAYFYALGVTQATQITTQVRYASAIANPEDRLTTDFQAAVYSGVLQPTDSEHATTITTPSGAQITCDFAQAARRLVALGTTSSPTQSISGSQIPNTLAGWLSYPASTDGINAGFWTPNAASNPGEYLLMIETIITAGNSTFISDIGSALKPTSANDLLKADNKDWLKFFTSYPNDLPAWTSPGSLTQRANAFFQYVQTILASPLTVNSPSFANPNDIPNLGTSGQDAISIFFLADASIDFSQKKLDEAGIAKTLSLIPSLTPAMQARTKKAIDIIHALYLVTAPTGPNYNLQFSYMEALYARGFTSIESIKLLTEPQFASALQGTIAYGQALTIWNAATGNVSPTPVPVPGSVFSPVNPGDLVDCIPPANLSPLGRIQYLHDLLGLSIGTATLGSIISTRRGPVGNFKATRANLELAIPQVDLVNESLEALGSQLSSVQGVVYDTNDKPGFPNLDQATVLAAIPEYSSPAMPVQQPSIYNTLASDFSSPNLPYSQNLDICRCCLCSLGTSRFETMRHFRKAITEFVLDPAHETSDFQSYLWRYPVRLDIATEYLCISSQELSAFTTSPTQDEMIKVSALSVKLDATSEQRTITVPVFLRGTGLTYCEFLALWKCGYVSFSPGEGQDYPSCLPCCSTSLVIRFPGNDNTIVLHKIVLFVRLWRKLRDRCSMEVISFPLLADICNVLNLYKGNNVNPDFIRQLASLFMLHEIFGLPFTCSSGSILSLWSTSSTASAPQWAISVLLGCVAQYAETHFCLSRCRKILQDIAMNLKSLARLAGFTDTHDWNSNPSCTLRFAEVLAKIYASEYTINELLFSFTKDTPRLPFPLGHTLEVMDEPFKLPTDCEENLWKLRHKLLCAEVSEERVLEWTWGRIEGALRREFGFVAGSTDALLSFGEHFFPNTLSDHGYDVPRSHKQYRVSLSASATNPLIWQAPPYGPFQYHTATSELVVELPLRDEAVFEQLLKLRQLNPEEQNAVKDLYYAPRLEIVPFALIFNNFLDASNWLIHEHSEKERFRFFQREFALFYRRCEIIAEHLSTHVTATTGQKLEHLEGKERSGCTFHVAWEILKHLIADENESLVPWENDSGAPPTATEFTWNPFLTGNSFAALLGLTGTGLHGEYKIGETSQWYEIRAPLSAFRGALNSHNVPVPMVIPSLGLTGTTAEKNLVKIQNGFAIGDEDCHDLGGAQPFQVTWTGVILIEHPGTYRFNAEHPPPNDCDSGWEVILTRGQKQWTVLSHNWENSPSCETPAWLHRGLHEIMINFRQDSPTFAEHNEPRRTRTGITICYCGPDTQENNCVLPLDKLYIESKSGPLSLRPDHQDNAGKYLKGRYYSTLRDIRRTYQRAFKAALFAASFSLSSHPTHIHHESSELRHILNHAVNFSGTSYYTGSSGSWSSHQAYFDFNFLPVTDPYLPPSPSSDQRVSPSPQRVAAMFDWWERIFDYTHLREKVKLENHRRLKEPVWVLFHDAADPSAEATDLVRLLDVEPRFANLVLKYFTDFTVVPTNLEDERWATRIFHARTWLEDLERHIFTRSISHARPDLWASDDPNLVVDTSVTPPLSGNQNLTNFFQTSCLVDTEQPHPEKVRRLNDELREHARAALISYLCADDRIAIASGAFATKPEDLTSLLLQDVEVGLSEETTRIEDAIFAAQTFVQRARIGLEPSITISLEFGKLWDSQFSTFEAWQIRQRRILYSENWIHWEELETARKSEAFEFLERELKRVSLSMPIADPSLPWPTDNSNLPVSTLDPIQSTDYASLNLQLEVGQQEGISLIGQPDRDGQPSWLAPVQVPPPSVEQSQSGSTSGSGSSSQPSASISQPTKTTEKQAVKSLQITKDTLGLGPQSGQFPLWFQAAIRLGLSFVRVAAAGIPPAFSPAPESQDGTSHDCMDEYYFWLTEGRRYDSSDATDDADLQIGGLPLTTPDPTSAWDDSSQLPGLLQWIVEPRMHLYWTRVHLGVFQPPRRSEQGFPLQGTPDVSLTFTGRTNDSLNFTIDSNNDGFRYDLATDTAAIIDGTATTAVAPSHISQKLPSNLPAIPYFVYFAPGAPIVPISPFCTSLAISGTLRSQCRYEDALQWCRSAFDPLESTNTWAQCSKTNPDGTSDTEGASNTKVTGNDKKSAEKDAEIPTGRDGPCCPTGRVGPGIARGRAVLLEYVHILLEWGESLLCRNSSDTFHQATVLINEAHRILGPQPKRVYAQDKGEGQDLTVSSFVASSAPLNPRLVTLFDRITTLRSVTRCMGSRKKVKGMQQVGSVGKMCCELDSGCVSCCQPYRFFSILPKALELTALAKSFGNGLLTAFEKGDGEYLAALREAHERHILDLNLENKQLLWRDADWQVQALQQQMQGALTRSRYYQGLLSTGLIGDENDYISSTQNASSTRSGAAIADATGQAMNIIPDFAVGIAGVGPYQATQIPIGSKIGAMFAAEGRMLSSVAETSSTNASLSLTNAGWVRRAQDWQLQVNVIAYEIAQIKRQTLGAERRRDSQLRDLNNHQQQMEHAAEVQDFMRDKFTKQELYLFLQQETAGLYRQAYDTAFQTATRVQQAFVLERGVDPNLLPQRGWNSFREGLMAGERLEFALRTMERKYMDLNFREYELTKHISLRVDVPSAFLQLREHGFCEVDLPEWMFDLDYPGQYMRRIRSISVSIPCVVGPYIGVNCRLRLLSSSIRMNPLLQGPVACCCHDAPGEHDVDEHVIHRRGGEEAIALSSGQNDSGLFELSFHDDRYLPFEFSGAVSRWRIELPPENNRFDFNTLTDFIIHLNYTSREGTPELRHIANERAQTHLPSNGIQFFDIRHDFPDIFSLLTYPKQKKQDKKHVDLPLRFRRGMFPFLVGRRTVRVCRIELSIRTGEDCDAAEHFDIQYLPSERQTLKKQTIHCIITSSCPRIYSSSFQVDLGPITGDSIPHEFGLLRMPNSLTVTQFFLLCHYTTQVEDIRCNCKTLGTCCCSSKSTGQLFGWKPRY